MSSHRPTSVNHNGSVKHPKRLRSTARSRRRARSTVSGGQSTLSRFASDRARSRSSRPRSRPYAGRRTYRPNRRENNSPAPGHRSSRAALPAQIAAGIDYSAGVIQGARVLTQRDVWIGLDHLDQKVEIPASNPSGTRYFPGHLPIVGCRTKAPLLKTRWVGATRRHFERSSGRQRVPPGICNFTPS